MKNGAKGAEQDRKKSKLTAGASCRQKFLSTYRFSHILNFFSALSSLLSETTKQVIKWEETPLYSQALLFQQRPRRVRRQQNMMMKHLRFTPCRNRVIMAGRKERVSCGTKHGNQTALQSELASSKKIRHWNPPRLFGKYTKFNWGFFCITLVRHFVLLCPGEKEFKFLFKGLYHHWKPDELNTSTDWG